MRFTPFQKYTLYTRLSLPDTRQRLQDFLNSPKSRFRLIYDGEIEGDEFTLYQYARWPDIAGRFSTSNEKTAIDIAVRFDKLAFRIGGFALGFLLIMFIGIGHSIWSNTHSFNAIFTFALFIAVSLFLIYFVVMINTLVITARSKKFLRPLFEAE